MRTVSRCFSYNSGLNIYSLKAILKYETPLFSPPQVTNIFIVNLAVADFFVILLCLPPTVVWDVTETWFLGEVLCKVVIYFQVSCRRDSFFFVLTRSCNCWYLNSVDYVNNIIYGSVCLPYGNHNQLLDITCQKKSDSHTKNNAEKDGEKGGSSTQNFGE